MSEVVSSNLLDYRDLTDQEIQAVSGAWMSALEYNSAISSLEGMGYEYDSSPSGTGWTRVNYSSPGNGPYGVWYREAGWYNLWYYPDQYTTQGS